jgi:hypothetical protein
MKKSDSGKENQLKLKMDDMDNIIRQLQCVRDEYYRGLCDVVGHCPHCHNHHYPHCGE